MAQAVGQDAQARSGIHLAGLLDRMHPKLDVLVVDRGLAEVLEIGGAACREVHIHGVADPVEREALQDSGQAQAVVAVEVGEQDPGDGRGRDAGEQHLALGPLPRVEQQPLGVPPEEVAVVVAVPGGGLARRPEHHQFPSRHTALLR